MDTFLQDLKFAIRSLRARPVIAVVAILALALGIGANSAIFSLVHAVLLRPLPFKDADRLVLIWHDYGKGMNLAKASLSVPTYLEYRDHVEGFESVGVATPWNANLTGSGDPERLQGSLVSGTFFGTLGVAPALGRDFLPEEDKPGGNRVVLLSDGLFRRRFGADASIVGKTISLNGETHTVVGVLPADFQFMMPVDLYKPVAFTPEQAAPENHGNEFLVGVARIKPGVTMAQAGAQLAALGLKLQKQYYPEGWHPVMFPLRDEIVGDLRPALLMLNAAVACVLLIACANIANLLLARATGRAREIAVRAALGAGRRRLARLLLTESLLLGVLGGAAGLVVAAWGIRVLQAASPPQLLQNVLGGRPAGINLPVLAFTFGVSVLTGVLFGLLPALRASKTDLHDTLKEGARGESVGAHGHRLLGGFVVSQVAVAFVLLVGAGLLLRSFARLREVDPGFRPERVMTMRVALPPNRYDDNTAIGGFYGRLVENLRALPGVTAAALVSNLPMSGNNSSGSFEIEGSPTPDGQPSPHGDSHYVSHGYFETMGIPLVQGRCFDGRDASAGTPSIIVDEVLAKRYWPDGSALGHRLAKYGEGSGKQPQRVGADRRRLGGARSGARPRSGSPRLQRQGDDRVARRHDDDAALRHVAARRVRGHGAAFGGGRPVRRARLLGGAAHPRDRRAHGARRAGGGRRDDGGAARHAAGAGRARRRRRPRDRADALHPEPALRHRRRRPFDLRPVRDGTRGRGVVRVLHPGPTRRARRPHHRAALRIERLSLGRRGARTVRRRHRSSARRRPATAPSAGGRGRRQVASR
jgi:predicted permease